MIEPQVHHNQRGIVGQQHGLTKLTETLEALTQGQTAQQTRDTQIQQQLTTQASALAQMQGRVRQLGLATCGLGALVVLLAALAWQAWHPADQGYARIVGTLDQALVQQWGSLPKPVQEQLSGAYGRLGLQPPGQRK